MAIIANKDDDLKYKKNQIELFFSVHSDVQERAEYLKSAYQDRYTEIIADGQRLGYKPQENGLLMWEGSYPIPHQGIRFFLDIVAQWTAQLIDKKEYFIQTDHPAASLPRRASRCPFLILRRFSSQPRPRVRPNHPFSLTRLCLSR